MANIEAGERRSPMLPLGREKTAGLGGPEAGRSNQSQGSTENEPAVDAQLLPGEGGRPI